MLSDKASNMNTNLCIACQRTFEAVKKCDAGRYKGKIRYKGDHHLSLQSFEKAVAAGCDICTVLYASSGFQALPAEQVGYFEIRLDEDLIGDCHLHYWSVFEAIPEPSRRYLGKFDLIAESRISLCSEALGDSTDSEATLRTIRKWYTTCLDGHANCPKAGNDNLPTRLLHFEGGHLKLVESTEIPSGTRFATLSHCWGGFKSLQLLRSNHKEFLIELPHDKLCKTFKDAIEVAKGLHIAYLWIDSLCIIQDDIEDWRRQASLMADVYGNSSITIAATHAKNGQIGCFSPRDPRDIAYGRVNLNCNDSIDPYIFCDLEGQEEQLESGALVQRAWAFQERLLSPRIVHFTRSQVFWECPTEILASEMFPNGYPHGFPSRHRRPRLRFDGTWEDIVENYSACKLTNWTDRLIALSGVAEWYNKRFGDEYLAGLWKNDLVGQLLWKSNSPEEASDLREYQAPSWSWASRNSALTFHRSYGMNEAYVEIVDFQIHPSANEMGQVTGGFIRLRCRTLIKARWSRSDGRIKVNIPPPARLLYCSWDEDPATQGVLYLLRLFHYDFGNPFYGIMVEPTSSRAGCFRRVGYFSYYSDTDEGDDESGDESKEDTGVSGKPLKSMSMLKEEEGTREYVTDEAIYESSAGEDGDGNKLYTIVLE